jgi:hypothetical protein
VDKIESYNNEKFIYTNERIDRSYADPVERCAGYFLAAAAESPEGGLNRRLSVTRALVYIR